MVRNTLDRTRIFFKIIRQILDYIVLVDHAGHYFEFIYIKNIRVARLESNE